MFDAHDVSRPIPPALQALLELFAGELAQVKFPDLDAGVLQEAAARVREKADGVARAQAALEAARAALLETQEALLQRGQRALAYARIYAEEDAALGARLEAISLPRPLRRGPRAEGAPALAEPPAEPLAEGSAPKRRGRPPKARPSASLFAEGSPEAALPGPAATPASA